MSTTNILDLNNRIVELEKNSGGSADSAKRSDIATEFSTETSYTAGNFVYHEGKLYQFNADHSAGAWDPTDVVEANVTDQIVSNYNTFKDYTEKSDIAPTFSDVNSYNKGDLVYYEDSLYQFTADHTAGAWTGTDAQQKDISDIVNGLTATDISYGSGTVGGNLDNMHLNNLSTNYVDIISYETTLYEFPSDGYLNITAKQTSTQAAVIRANIFGNNEQMNMLMGNYSMASGTQTFSCLQVRKGMKVKIDVNINPNSENRAWFIPLT